MKATLEELPKEGKTRRWRARIDNGFDAHGKRDRRYFRFDGKQTAAEGFLRAKVAEVDRGANTETRRLTVGQYLKDWLDGQRPHVAHSTFDGYENIVTRHLVPGLGNIPLLKLDPRHVRAFYAREVAALPEGAGLSAQTVVHHHRVLHKAIAQALNDGALTIDPLRGVKPPKREHKEMTALEESETLRLLDALRDTPLYLPVVLAVQVGLRRGEILGLLWPDIDLKARTVTIRRSLEQTSSGVAYKTPKTENSRRTVGLPSLAVAALVAQSEARIARGPKDGDPVVCQEDGALWPPDVLSKTFSTARKRLGFKCRFHDLRHSFASQQIKQDVPLPVLSRLMGHATIAVTVNTYHHLLPGQQADAASRMDAAYEEAAKKHKPQGSLSDSVKSCSENGRF